MKDAQQPELKAEPLTLLQSRFVDAYLGEANGNATKAAKLAGYTGSDVTLASVGYENLRKPQILDAIAERMTENCLGTAEVLARLSDQVKGAGEFIEIDSDGMPTVDFRALAKAGRSHIIKSVKNTPSGKVVEFYDAQSALVHLGRFHKLFTDRLELLSDGELIAKAARFASDAGIPFPSFGADDDPGAPVQAEG